VKFRAPRGRARALCAALACLSAIALAGLTACGSSSGEKVGTASSPLKLYNDKGSWTKYFQSLAGLSKQETSLTMKPVGYTDQANYAAFIKSSFRTKAKPDLFTWYTGAQLADLVKNQFVADSSSLWQQGIKDGNLSKDLEKYYTVDGKQYCVPLNVAYWVMFYNKKIFAKYGLTPPTSWAELLSDAATLKSHGVTPFYNTSVLFSFVWFEQILAGSDPDLYNRLSEGKAKYTDPGVVKAMQEWKKLIDAGYMNDPTSKQDFAAVLKTGKAAMAPWGTWFNTLMTSAGLKSGSDYGIFVIPNVNPSLPKTSLIFESGPLCASRQARDVTTSNKFLQWWIKPQPQAQWSNSRGDVSGNPKVTVPDQALDGLSKEAGSGKYALINRYFEATPPPVLQAALDGFGAFEVHPDTYMKVLKDIQQAADDYWSNR
jgi:multiple sugar transport system substrate-binding protein